MQLLMEGAWKRDKKKHCQSMSVEKRCESASQKACIFLRSNLNVYLLIIIETWIFKKGSADNFKWANFGQMQQILIK